MQYFEKDKEEFKYTLEEMNIGYDYVIEEGDKIYNKSSINKETVITNNKKTKDEIVNSKVIKVIINGKEVELKNKMKYVFIDIFDFFKFDLSYSRGNLILMVNDKKAGYQDVISQGDIIKVYFESTEA